MPEHPVLSDQILLTEAVESGRRWWEPYPHTTDAEKAQALVAACEYWHAAFECAIDTRDTALAEVDRLREAYEALAIGRDAESAANERLRDALRGVLDVDITNADRAEALAEVDRYVRSALDDNQAGGTDG